MDTNPCDRITDVTDLAAEVFEDREAAISWMYRPNAALGGRSPAAMCDTKLGEKQVRRLLQALKWGGVV